MKSVIFKLLSLAILTCVSMAGIAPIGAVYAAVDPCTSPGSANSDYCQNQNLNKAKDADKLEDPVAKTIANVTNVITMVSGIVAVLWIIFSAIKIATSSGDSQKVSSGRNGVIYAAVGLIIIIVANIIVRFVVNQLL